MSMVTDLRQAVRLLAKTPGFTIIIVLVLTLGIGANTAIFSIVNGVLLQPLPFAEAHRLVAIDTTVRNEPDDTAYLDFLDWKAQATSSFDRMAAYATAAATLTGRGDAVGLPLAVVSSDLFSLLGVAPIQGRVFRADDDARGAPRTAVISEGAWGRVFSRDPSVVGSAITLDGDSVTVIGVMPAGFEFPFDAEDPTEVWMPIMASRFAAQWAEQRGASFLKALGRLRPGVAVPGAQAELATVAARIAQENPRNGTRGVLVRPFQDVLVGNYRLGLVVLLSAVAAVLLIACANVANLLLARGTARRREIAVRTALGASRARIVRQFLCEGLVLAGLGGLGGTVVALWGLDAIVRISPVQIPRLHGVQIDRIVLGFTVLASMLTGILCGMVPALQLSHPDPGDALKDGDRGGSGAHGARTRQALVVAEVALSLVLLAAAGLLVRSLIGLQRIHPGFVTERAIVMQMMLPQTRYPEPASMIGFYRRLDNELQALPGAKAAALSTTLPLTGSNIGVGFTIDGRPADPATRTSAAFFGVSPGYFSTMGIPIVRGRGFSERDDEQAAAVVVVSESMAAKYFPGEDAIGKRITISYNKTGPREIVGIAGDVKQGDLTDTHTPQMYAPFVQTPWPFISAVVRTTAAPEAAAASLRQALARLDRLQSAGEILTLDDYLSRAIATPRFTALLVGSFAGLALLLAGFGLYGVMAYSVAQRRREIGIRMALGAQAGDVRALVVWQALRMGAAGLAIGLAGAAFATRVLDSLLFGVSAGDPATFAAVSAALISVLVFAAYLPARRATRVDPMVALRTE
jgi:putative ABC transport system permease protein